MSSHPNATFTRREFMVYERVMDGRAHHEAALEVDAALARADDHDPLERLSWAQWDGRDDTDDRSEDDTAVRER